MRMIYVEFIKKDKCDISVYIEANVCDVVSTPDHDGANIESYQC